MEKRDCFVIMPIGISETEDVWNEVFKPAIEGCGLLPRRVDKDDDGRLLPLQIGEWVNHAAIIVADLTFARPNCYFEIGYAMGLNRHSSLVLCCRNDHFSDHSDFDSSKNRIHFDLQSYSIIKWTANDLSAFKDELVEKINHRLPKVSELQRVDEEKPKASAVNAIQEFVRHQQQEAMSWKKGN